MKLIWRIVLNITIILSGILILWAVLFHFAVIKQVNDEIDDTLELFSERLIKKVLVGETLPDSNNGTNNTYFLQEVNQQYIDSHNFIEYSNEDVFIASKDELEPSRVLRTIFRNANGEHLLLTVATPTVDSEDLRHSISLWMAILYAVIILIIILVCAIVVWKTIKPLYTLLSWIEHNNISSGVQPLNNPTSIREFAKLNDAILSSAKRNELLFNKQKEFIGNASHELQTPIAVCQSHLELLMDSDMREEQMEEVVKALQSLDYMSKINKELLFINKIDNGQFIDNQSIDLSKIVHKALDDCQLIFAHRNIVLSTSIEEGVSFKMNLTLASAMIYNLIKNSYVHNDDNGIINVLLSSKKLEISNSGSDTPLDSLKIFDRFYQGSKKEGSTGLGLSIVKAICDSYSSTVSYTFSNSLHHFTISFGNL